MVTKSTNRVSRKGTRDSKDTFILTRSSTCNRAGKASSDRSESSY